MKEVNMKDVKQNDKTSMSANQMKKLEKKKQIEKSKRNARLIKVLSVCVIALICVGLVSAIGYNAYRDITKIKPSSDYSAYLTDDGLIKDVKATSVLELADYNNIKVPLSDIEYSDEKVEADIQTLLEEYSNLETVTDALIVDGDKVNIDYVGTLDGVEFDGGSTNGEGYDLVIGSDSLVDDFEDQLIGSSVGDEVTVNVTFPTDYESENLAGKDVVFQVVINGIYETPEFTDALVKENLSEYASTADEYREYVKKSKYEENLTTWLEDYLLEKTTVLSYPEDYTNHLKSIRKYEDQSTYDYMIDFYNSMGSEGPANFEEYVGMSEAKYDAQLAEAVQSEAKKDLIIQAIFETEGLTATVDEYSTYFSEATTDSYEALVEQNGKGYVMQQIIYEKVLEYIKGHITVE